MKGIRIESAVVALRGAEWDVDVYRRSGFKKMLHTACDRFSRASIESLNPNSCSIARIGLSCGLPFSDRTLLSPSSVPNFSMTKAVERLSFFIDELSVARQREEVPLQIKRMGLTV